MPRLLDPALGMALDRANPNVAYMVELNVPDVAQVLRRASDQLLLSPPLLTQTPANSLAADPAGALTLSGTPTTIASFTHQDDFTTTHIPKVGLAEDQVRGLAWLIDPAFGRGVLQHFTARVSRLTTGLRNNLALQIYRRQLNGFASTFVPLLAQPIVWANTDAKWTMGGGLIADADFDLTGVHLEVGTSNVPAVGSIGEEQAYYFVLEAVNADNDNFFAWARDRTSARTIAGIGTFVDRRWFRQSGTATFAWLLDNTLPAAVPFASLSILTYPATSQAVYALTLPSTPAATSIGRVVFERSVPTGAAAALELSTAGSGGPWTAVKDGDVVAAHQATYHLRATLTADAAHRIAPAISAMGVEFATPVDASAEAIVEPIAQQIAVPFLAAGVGEGTVEVLRTGRRDYRDGATDVAVGTAVSKLEIDVRLGSRHPAVTRDKWMLIDRALVNNRAPSSTSEKFSLLSYLKILKQKIPQRAETVNVTRNVVSCVTVGSITTVTVDGGPLPNAETPDAYRSVAAGGTQNYFMRVRQSSQAGVSSGYVQTIDDNDSTHPSVVVFQTPLPGTLIAGDVVEIHSGAYAQTTLKWVNADPYDVWWDILTVQCAVPPERIGYGALGRASRSGLPPRVTERAPGDTFTQAKLNVTLELTSAEEASGLIDQLSFIMGGATVEIAGQIVFRQIYPLRDATGAVVVSPEPIAATFDVRNMADLDCPVGLEQRIATLACDYGVDTTAASSTTPPALTTVFGDVDAIAYLDAQPIDEFAVAAIPSEIARWCFNSTDGGAYLAGMLTQQVVRAGSTGLRVWSWTATEARPELVVGDRVAVMTDRYTDFDPSRGLQLRGWWAYPMVIVSVEGGGRQLRGYMLGLSDAVRIKGGLGTLATPSATKTDLVGFTWFDSADGTTRTYVWTRGTGVDTVFVYVRTLEAPIETDPFDFTDDPPSAILRAGTDSFTITKPVQGEQVFAQFEPRTASLDAGTVRRVVVDPAPSAMSVKIRRTITNATADLEIEVDGGVSDWPIELDVFENDPDGAPLLQATLTAHTILDKLTYPQLGARPLPDRQIAHWWAEIENVGEMKDWDVAAASRDPLAVASVTVLDYRSDAGFLVVLDKDTDSVRFTVPGGKTKTIATPPGTTEALYNVGDLLDDATIENALKVDEVRVGYKIEVLGGGTWLTIWGNGAGQGRLHGQASNPPTIEVLDLGISTNGDTASPIVSVATPTGEDVGLFLKDAEGISAPIYSRTAGSGSTTIGYVPSGTSIGPTDYFSAGGAATHKLAGIPLVRAQTKHIYLQAIGKDSGVESPWIPIALSLMAQPVLESTSLAWDQINAVLRATAVGGPYCASVKIEFSDSSTFATISSTVIVALADGARTTQTLALSVGQEGKPWFARFTPSNNATWASGLPGAAQVQEVAVPAPTSANASGTVSIDTGQYSFTADLPAGAQSIRWGSFIGGANVGYPSDASVTASGSIVTGGSPISVNGAGTLSYGQTVGITIVPFTGPSATGTALTAIHIRGSYVTYSASKSVTYSRMSWNDLGRLGFTADANNSIISPAVPIGTIRDRFGMTAITPVGAVLTFASFDVVWNSATNPLGSFVLSVYANGGVLNFGSASAGGGAQTVAFTLGATTLLTGQVGFYSNWGNALGSATADAAQAELHDVTLTYTQTTPVTTV